MPFSVFDLICPTCGSLLTASARGEARCPCGAVYLVRMGHLVPLVAPPAPRLGGSS